MLICHLCFLFLIIIQISIGTTSIKTFPTINLKENVPIQTKVINLMQNEDEMKKYKLILLNLGGFETNLFEIKTENILTKNEIDREQLIGEKRCFDRLYCLIELHILVNDGQQYWVIPIHIIDENDNKPTFKNSSIELKFELNNLNEYKIPFEGAIDLDEGINNKIYYFLDCSNDEKLKRDLIINKKTRNCFPLFDLIIFSQSLINQNDQLGIKLNPSLSSLLLNEYELILFAFNLNKNNEKELINSMKIKIKINKILEKPKFILSEYKFILKELKKGQKIGRVEVKSNNLNEKILFKIENETNDFEINSINGELILLNENLINKQFNLLIKSFYLINSTIYSLINIQIFIRLNQNISINYQLINPSLIINNSNQFIINKNNFSSNEILFYLIINSLDYPLDHFDLSLLNYQSLFSLSSSSSLSNNYLLKFKTNSSLSTSTIYYLIIQIKHQLTNQFLSNLTIQLQFQSSSCLQNTIFHLYQTNKTKLIAKIKVIETNLNNLSFSTFSISNKELIIDQCRMIIDEITENETLNQSQYELCSSFSNQCFLISLINQNSQKIFKRFLRFRPIELTILCLSVVFILATITLIVIICRLRGFHLCLSIKNYLFYGKKYGLNRAQRISSTKINQRVQSIVVRESQSPSIQHIKALEPYIFNINKYFEEEKIPSINLYPESSSNSQMPTSLSCSSSIERDERTISNIDQDISSSSIRLENKQLIQMITSNDDLDVSQLASEV